MDQPIKQNIELIVIHCGHFIDVNRSGVQLAKPTCRAYTSTARPEIYRCLADVADKSVHVDRRRSLTSGRPLQMMVKEIDDIHTFRSVSIFLEDNGIGCPRN